MVQVRSFSLCAVSWIAVLYLCFVQTSAFGQTGGASLVCPTGTTKTIVPSSPLCIVRANVKAAQDTDFTLTGYDHLVGNCTLAAGVPQPPQTPSSQITVTAGQQRTSWLQGSPWVNQLDPLLTCPAGAVKKTCAFTSGSGPTGEILCACYPAGVTPPATVIEPTYICVANSCGEGQYWCSSESACKSPGVACGTVMCNNNNTCDAGESCNCGDCTNGGTDDKDRCGLTSSGAQMVCMKDKDSSTISTPAVFDSAPAMANFNTVNAQLATYLSQPGNANIAAGEFGNAATELQMTQDTRLDSATSFTKDEAWARAKMLLSIPDSAVVLWSQTSIKYSSWASANERYLYSYVIQETAGPRQILFATEFLPGIGWRKVYLIGKSFPLPAITAAATVQVGACCPAGAQWSSVQGKCAVPTPPTPPVAPGCAEGQYFCSTENICKPAGAACSTITCNNNSVCDANESCNCSDCNQVIDHCGINGSGQQLICTKDTAPICYTDKFPYCLSACLDGKKMDPVTGQCSANVSTTTSTSPNLIVNGDFEQGNVGFTSQYAYSTSIMSEGTYAISTSVGAIHLSLPNCMDHSGFGKFMGVNAGGNPASNIYCQQVNVEQNTNYSLSAWVSFIGIPSATLDFSINSQNIGSPLTLTNTNTCGWSQFSNQWNSGTNTTANICIKNNNTTVSGNDFSLDDIVFKKADANTSVSCQNFTYPIEGNGFVKNDAASVAKYCTQKSFTSGSVVSTDSNGAGTSTWNGTAWIFSGADQSYTKEVQCCGGTVSAPVCQSYPNAQTHGGYLHMAPPSITQFCKESGFNFASLKSWYTESGSLRVWNGTSWIEDIQGGAVQDMQCCKNSTNNTSTCSAQQFSSQSAFVTATGATAGSLTGILENNRYYDYTFSDIGLSLDFNVSASAHFGGVYTTTRLPYKVWAMGYEDIDVSFTPAVNAFGFDFVEPINDPADCRGPGGACAESTFIITLFNGTTKIKDYTFTPENDIASFFGATSDQPITKATIRETIGNLDDEYFGKFYVSRNSCASAPTTIPASTTTPTTTPQLGACCPPGSAWNSTENRCVPATCGEGQFYCAAQQKCLAGGTTCSTAVCNNDGVCGGDESCQCGDCVNGGPDDKDKCSIIGGVQAMCSDDNLNDSKPGACCIAPKKWSSQTNTCVECNNTQAPSELQAGLDQPYITCTGNGDATKTHFKYKITKLGGSDAPFVSEIKPLGEQVLGQALPVGDYRVECFYGTGASVDVTSQAPDTCIKTMSVKDTAQGCSRIYGYKGSTLSNEMTSPDPFDASFRCGSRLPSTGLTNAYALRFGTQNPAFLQYDSIMSLLFNELAIGPISTQTNTYSIPIGSTPVSCAVKVGNGYSTNNSCNIRACAGGECSVPQTFSVVHSGNAFCTTQNEDDYSIGCNPEASQTARDSCVKWFQDTFTARTNSNSNSFTLPFVINNVIRNIQCTKYAPGTLPGGLNMYDDFVCTTQLPNGETVELFSGDRSLQTTAYTVRKDRDKPEISEVKYFTDDTRTTPLTDNTRWQKKNIFAEVTCIDRPLDESLACACAPTVDPSSSENTAWSEGIPDSNLGGDIMRYSRVISASISGQTVRVIDTASNQSQTARTITLGIDVEAPRVTLTDSGAANNKTLTINVTDSLSKIWKTTGTPTVGTNISGIVYKKVPKANADTALYDENCGITSPVYASVTDTSGQTTAQAVINNINLTNDVVAYCVQDNAGNVTRGIYPSESVSCFSATNMTTIPNLTNYRTLLQTRKAANQYGYGLSEDTTNAACFRSILSSNIATLVTNQYSPSSSLTLDWSQPAKLKNTNTPNTNGYYYYMNQSNTSTANTITLPATNPTGTGQKVIVVDGSNVQITSNITYSGTDKTLVIIARKINGNGGNIYISPSVTRIDAVLIADGALMNATTSGSTTDIKNWIDDAMTLSNRLTINGRLYSFNTRGGSMNADLTPVSANGKYFDQITLRTDGTPGQSAAQDLEGFRTIKPDGNNTCSTAINYRVFTSGSLPTILQKPNGFGGGACGF